MKAYQHHTWSWDFNGLSMHSYTVGEVAAGFQVGGIRRRRVRADS